MKLLVTRPEPDGTRLGQRLKISGHDPLVLPLMKVDYLEGRVDFTGVQAVAFTSANGVRALEASHNPEKQAPDRSMPVFAVGQATAAAARRAGFTSVHVAGGDVDHLAAHMGAMLEPEDGAIIHIAGSVVAGDLKDALASFGFEIRRHVLYDTLPLDTLPQDVVTAIKDGTLEGVVVYSPRTGRILVELMQAAGLGLAAANMTCYALSANVADAVAALDFADCLVAQTPDEDALMALLEDD